MIRLFIEGNLREKEQVELSVFQAHYVRHVMRLKENDEITCFNGRQGEWLACVSYIKKQTFLKIQQQVKKQQNLPECILCPALVKKESMDFIWQKATELGATKIYPIISERSVVKSFNLTHALAIVREACEQCERLDIPEIMSTDTLSNTMEKLKNNVCLIWLSERGEGADFDCGQTPAFFVGPEGGWSEKEQQLLRKNTDCEWHLGKTILRAETACLAALAVYQEKKK